MFMQYKIQLLFVHVAAKVYNKNGNAIVDARDKNIVLKEGTVAEYYGEPKYMVWRGHKKSMVFIILVVIVIS